MAQPPDDPMFGKVGMQLIETPVSSREALKEAARNGAEPPPAHALFPIESAKSWVAQVFSASHRPPSGTAFVSFFPEQGNYDVIRSVHRVKQYEIEIAQTKSLFCIKVQGARPDISDQERAETVANEILEPAIQLERLGDFANGSYGKMIDDPDSESWLSSLRWWSDKDVVGFLLVKSAGPTRELIGPMEEANARWR